MAAPPDTVVEIGGRQSTWQHETCWLHLDARVVMLAGNPVEGGRPVRIIDWLSADAGHAGRVKDRHGSLVEHVQLHAWPSREHVLCT